MKFNRIMADMGVEANVPGGGEAPAASQHPRRRRRSRAGSLAAHPAFVLLLATWGAALAGLGVLVMPVSSTARIALLSGLDALGAAAHPVIAAIAALAGGAFAFGIAQVLSLKARRAKDAPSIVAMARMRPIRPAEELGSESLDAPLETMPLGTRVSDWLAKNAADMPKARAGEEVPAAPRTAQEALGDGAAAIRSRLVRVLGEAEAARAPAGENVGEEPVQDEAPAEGAAAGQSGKRPPELDLAQFAQLPGRNAVWVEGPLPRDMSDRDQQHAEPVHEEPQ